MRDVRHEIDLELRSMKIDFCFITLIYKVLKDFDIVFVIELTFDWSSK